jgi:hypothetical protein
LTAGVDAPGSWGWLDPLADRRLPRGLPQSRNAGSSPVAEQDQHRQPGRVGSGGERSHQDAAHPDALEPGCYCQRSHPDDRTIAQVAPGAEHVTDHGLIDAGDQLEVLTGRAQGPYGLDDVDLLLSVAIAGGERLPDKSHHGAVVGNPARPDVDLVAHGRSLMRVAGSPPRNMTSTTADPGTRRWQ